MHHTHTEGQLVGQTVTGLFTQLALTMVLVLEEFSVVNKKKPSASKAKNSDYLI